MSIEDPGYRAAKRWAERQQQQPDAEDEPIPLTPHAAVPPFPVGSFPKPVAAMITAVAEFTQTDPAMAGTSALSALSACTGGHALIEVRGGWREPMNTYTATVAHPGERKSAVQQFLMWPLQDAERALQDYSFGARAEAATRKQIAELAAEKAKQAAARADPDQRDAAEADAIGAAAMADQITVPVVPRLIADDITLEAAASLLAEQGGRLAIISAEGGIFDIIAGRYSNNIPNLDLWLKGHSGDPLRVDRKGREPEYIAHPALTLGLMIQPAVLRAIAGNPVFRGRGFLARVLYALPRSRVGRRDITPKPINPDTVKTYNAAIGTLAAGLVGWVGDPAVLTLTPAAHETVTALQRDIEPSARRRRGVVESEGLGRQVRGRRGPHRRHSPSRRAGRRQGTTYRGGRPHGSQGREDRRLLQELRDQCVRRDGHRRRYRRCGLSVGAHRASRRRRG